MAVSRKNALPLYHQLRELLAEKIERGDWEPGHQLPTEAELSAEFTISRATVRQALQLLENEGLIERVQGRGTFVGRPKIEHNLMSLLTTNREMSRIGAIPRNQLHHVRLVQPSAAAALRLDLGAGDLVYEVKRTAIVDEPLMLITSWLPARLFPGLESKPLDQRSLRNVLREHFGVEASHQRKEVEVTILDHEDAALLQANPGAPALLLTYVTRLENGTAFEYRRMLVRGDRCKYYVDLDSPEFE